MPCRGHPGNHETATEDKDKTIAVFRFEVLKFERRKLAESHHCDSLTRPLRIVTHRLRGCSCVRTCSSSISIVHYFLLILVTVLCQLPFAHPPRVRRRSLIPRVFDHRSTSIHTPYRWISHRLQTWHQSVKFFYKHLERDRRSLWTTAPCAP
jgi:hypothetical protein